MKPLSEQLADLSARAKKAEDDEAKARKEARTAIQARVDKLQADAATRTAKMGAAVASTKDAAVGQWTTMRQQIKAENDRIRANIDAKKTAHDKASAEKKADRAADNAAAAIAFAYDAIDIAEAAVLDATMTRVDADAAQ
jgi:hypothetical protein